MGIFILFYASCCLWTVLEGGLKMNHVLAWSLGCVCVCVCVWVGMVTQPPLKACRHAEFVLVLVLLLLLKLLLLLLILIIIKSPDIETFQN